MELISTRSVRQSRINWFLKLLEIIFTAIININCKSHGILVNFVFLCCPCGNPLDVRTRTCDLPPPGDLYGPLSSDLRLFLPSLLRSQLPLHAKMYKNIIVPFLSSKIAFSWSFIQFIFPIEDNISLHNFNILHDNLKSKFRDIQPLLGIFLIILK